MRRLSRISSPRPLAADIPRYDSIVQMLDAAVTDAPDTTAVVCGDRSVSYREFGRAVAGLAQVLGEQGVAGGRVVVLMANSIEADVAIMAVMAAHAQAAPVNAFFTVSELMRVVAVVAPVVILCDPARESKALEVAHALSVPHVLVIGTGGLALDRWTGDDRLRLGPDHRPAADDPALLIFTGGSTGAPRGVNHTHRSLGWSCRQHCTVWPVRFGSERFLNVAPMFHIWGLVYASWVPIYARSTLVMIPRYEPDRVVEALGQYRITIFAGGPAPIYLGLLASPQFVNADLTALRYCLSGGAPCPEHLHREWLQRTGCALLEGWGMTEGAPFCLNPSDGPRKLMSVGTPVPETEIEVVDVDTGNRVLALGEIGEIRVRGPQLMSGYRNDPDQTGQALRDGWMYTGDIGYADEDGFVFLVDRKKDIVIVGGYNVYPREIDEILFEHPAIREAATIGQPDPRLGEAVVAFVVCEPGRSITDAEFFDYCATRMVKYKRPVAVHFVDALPRTGTNKINRRALRERVTTGPAGLHGRQ